MDSSRLEGGHLGNSGDHGVEKLSLEATPKPVFDNGAASSDMVDVHFTRAGDYQFPLNR
jgi:hypothetical protein